MHRDGNAAQECRCCCSDAHSHPSIVEAELPEAVLPSHAISMSMECSISPTCCCSSDEEEGTSKVNVLLLLVPFFGWSQI